MASSAYIKAMHPKSGILPQPQAISRILAAGWVAQLKIHGHRCQIHVPADPKTPLVLFTRHGTLHKKIMPPKMVSEVRRLFTPEEGWNVIDTEWLKPEDKLFVFDFLKKDGKLLRDRTYPERWELLPRAYISRHVMTLPLLRDLTACLKVLSAPKPHMEGLVFKSLTRKGFHDSSIIRCRAKV